MANADYAQKDRGLILPDLELARRHTINRQRAFFFFGHNDAVGTTYEDIWPGQGDINWQTAAVIVSISSSNAADAASGLGAQSIEIHGLGPVGEDQDEVVVMNGTTEVDTVLKYCRVNKMHNEVVGTYGGSHQGDITARVDSGGAKTGEILALMDGEEGSVDSGVQYGSGEANQGLYSVPLGEVLYLTNLSVNAGITGNRTTDVILYEREGILNTTDDGDGMDPRRIIWAEFDFQGEVNKVFKSHIKIKQLTDIWFRAKASGQTNRVDVSLDFYRLTRDSDGA